MDNSNKSLVYNISLTLSEFDNFLLISHVRPDGDAVGSLLGLYHHLIEGGKKATPFLADPVPEIYNFLPGIENIQSTVEPSKFDAVIVMDTNGVDRLGLPLPIGEYSKLIVNIDHHPSNESFGTINWVNPQASSASEMVLDLIGAGERDLSPATATCLYAGIMTDTGRFQFSNTTGNTFRNCAVLADKGADIVDLAHKLYMNIPLPRIRLTGRCLAEAQIKGSVAWAVVTRDDMERYQARNEHLDGIVNQLSAAAGIEVAVLFHEMGDGLIKVSLRSRSRLDVNELAGHFGGGGHVNAAGLRIELPLSQAVDKVMQKVFAAAEMR